ncbi:MAG: diadenylate cyclase CdaA [Bacteroidota bacterium]
MIDFFGFLPVTFWDLVDIAVVAALVYVTYRAIRGTIAVQIAGVILAIFALNALVQAMGLRTLQALFGTISDVFVLAVIILFAPEIRRLLFMLGRNPLVRQFVRTSAREQVTDEIVAAVRAMSRDRTGSLLVLARATGLRNFIETGTRINAEVERDLLTSIFFKNSPLHDGATIIQGAKIAAARCILPVSEAQRLDPHLGLRHRAAVGVSERSDAFVIVTSEETGRISVAENGVLSPPLTIEELRRRLSEAFTTTAPATEAA